MKNCGIKLSNCAFLAALVAFFNVTWLSNASAQGAAMREKVAVLNIDAKGIVSTDPVLMGNIVRTELDKLDKFEVMDRYDIDYLLKNNDISLDNCYGKRCLVDVGKKIKADKMLTGSVELLGEQIIVSLKMIDVASESVEKSQVLEFLNLRQQLPAMVGLVVKKMFEQPVDNELLTKLTKKFDYESAINNPEAERLNLSGPRMGFTAFMGSTAQIFREPKSVGGFDVLPFMFQFGYQFEVQYLNQGNFQALFEIIPLVTGLDQGKFLPSISLLNGMRSNVGGWEFAFGPILYMRSVAKGYYENGKWVKSDAAPNAAIPLEERLDSRGVQTFASGFVFAVGKSFKSGNLNIPVNAFFIPDKNGSRFGVSMGFNAKKK